MNRFKQYLASITAVIALAMIAVLAIGPHQSREQRIYAQFSTNVPGFYTGGNNAVPQNTAIGSALAVTNPASNFLMLVQGGPLFCTNTGNTSSEQIVGQSTIQLAASQTYLIVWNCAAEQLYAKTAVVGPGTPAGLSNVGIPNTILAPVPNLEIPIALVVCGNTNCGNTANGTITDQRPLGNFPGSGLPLNTSLFANLPTTNVSNGTMIYCSDCLIAAAPNAACAGSGNGTLAIRTNGAWICN